MATPPRKPLNAQRRPREHLTEAEVQKLIRAAKTGRHAHRNATIIAEILKRDGKLEGRVEGKLEGELKKALEIARNLFSAGVEFKIVSQATGLPRKKLMELRNK